MSYLHSTRLTRPQMVVAVAGATGRLGRDVTHTFLTAYRPFFPHVLALVRDTKSSDAQDLATLGAEIHKIDSLDALSGVDVLVSALSVSAAVDVQDALFDRALAAGVLVYFPSEFGIDHGLNNFPGFDHPDWEHKTFHVERARDLAEDKMKIISVYNGLFLDIGIGPWFGFDTANSKYGCVGAASQRITFTAKADIARSVCELALLALKDPSKVPDEVRLAGCTAQFAEVREIVQRIRGTEEIALEEEDLDSFRKGVEDKMRRRENIPPSWHLRILGGEEKLDYSRDNHNELVNPEQTCWKWKTVEDFITEVGGHP